MKIIDRKDLDGDYAEIVAKESHHDHRIIEDDNGIYRWERNDRVDNIVEKINLNNLIALLELMGYDRNSEVQRKLYRDMGVSLYMYWEVFYWDVNNEKTNEYEGPKLTMSYETKN